MMSTAIVIAVGTERTDARPTIADRTGEESMSFAQSFGERAGLSTGGQVKNIAGEALSEVRESLDESVSKKLNEPSASSSDVVGKVIAGQLTQSDDPGNVSAKSSETKNLVAVPVSTGGKLSDSSSHSLSTSHEKLQNTVAKSTQTAIQQSKGMVANSSSLKDELTTGKGAEAPESPTLVSKLPIEEASKAVQPLQNGSSAALDGDPAPNTTGEPPAPQKKVLEKDQIVVFTKKGEKRNTVSLPKATGLVDSPTGAQVRSHDVIGTQGATSAPGQALPPETGQWIDFAKTAASGSSEAVSTMGKTATANSGVATNVSYSKKMTAEGKPVMEGTEERLDSSASSTDPTKSEQNISKPDTSAASAGKDSDGKTSATAAPAIHVELANGVVAPGVTSGIAFGHALADATGLKAQPANAVPHASGSNSVSGEQDGASVADSGGMHRMLTATPTTLEVGLTSGTQGWLKIRAEMTGSGLVNASLSSGTSAGQEMLHRELPALTAYLHQERVAVNAVVVNANTVAGAEFQSTGAMTGEDRGQMQQRGHGGGGQDRQGSADVGLDLTDNAAAYENLNGVGDDALSSGVFTGGGGYLNVRV